MSRFLGLLTEEQSESDDYRSHLLGEADEGDWFIKWDYVEDEFVECLCVFYDSAVCYTFVPLTEVRAQIA